MTNGTLNKRLVKLAKTATGDQLLEEAKDIMNLFPLSSHHLLYDHDEAKVSPEAWQVLLAAAVATDKEKLEDANTLRTEAGLKPDKSFGRFGA